MFMEQELTAFEHICLRLRNILVLIAAILFILSILPFEKIHEVHNTISGIAYFFGAGAYLIEFIEQYDYEKRHNKDHKRKLFMPNVFGILYIVLAICHLFE